MSGETQTDPIGEDNESHFVYSSGQSHVESETRVYLKSKKQLKVHKYALAAMDEAQTSGEQPVPTIVDGQSNDPQLMTKKTNPLASTAANEQSSLGTASSDIGLADLFNSDFHSKIVDGTLDDEQLMPLPTP